MTIDDHDSTHAQILYNYSQGRRIFILNFSHFRTSNFTLDKAARDIS